MADVLKVFQPSKYYSIYVKSGVRPDGRDLNSFGLTSININCISTGNGSALVHLRDTVVLCGVKAGLANPNLEEPLNGFVVPNVDLPPVCSRRFMPGPPCEEAQVYSQLMADLFKDSSIMDLKDLCIVEGKLCWCLYADITCLNYGGSVLDACVLALVAAIKSTSLPKVLTENDTIEVVEGKDSPLIVKESLFASTFAIFENRIVAGPTVEEETLASSLVTLFMKESGMIANIFMGRGGPVSDECLKQCIRQSKKRRKKLSSLVENVLGCNPK